MSANSSETGVRDDDTSSRSCLSARLLPCDCSTGNLYLQIPLVSLAGGQLDNSMKNSFISFGIQFLGSILAFGFHQLKYRMKNLLKSLLSFNFSVLVFCSQISFSMEKEQKVACSQQLNMRTHTHQLSRTIWQLRTETVVLQSSKM